MATPRPAHIDPGHTRPWLTRGAGECAFPHEGEGAETRSCCRPCDPGGHYCDEHRGVMKGPRGPSLNDLLREYARFLA